jgi:glycosyltransferase involved in cell wall biosynthesis
MIPGKGRRPFEGVRVVWVTALGISARSFLQPHFRRLRENGFDVILVCSNDDDARAAARHTGIRHIPVRIKQSVSAASDGVALWRLWRLLRRLRPQIVHAHMSKAGLLGVLAGWLAGVPVRIYHNHGMAALTARGPRRLMLRAVEWVANRAATHTLFCGESTRAAALAEGLAQVGKARVLGSGTISGVDIAAFSPDRIGDLRESKRRAWGVPADAVVVGFVGRIVPHKGIATLLAAWRCLDAKHRERATLVLVGVQDSPDMTALVDAAVAEDLGVRAVGWTDDMVAAYSAMDLLVLPSWYEGLPYSVLEAQAMGLPVIVTRATGNVDAVEDEVTGLVVPPGDPHALAGALSRLIASPEERARMGSRGRVRVTTRFERGRVLDRMMAFYRAVLPNWESR